MSMTRRSPLWVMIAVIRALSFREFKTRAGSYHLGWLWVLAEPMAHVIVLSVLWGFRDRQPLPGVDMPMFLLTGLIPFKILLNTFTQCGQAVSANSQLFVYKQVKPIDTFLTRAIVETSIYSAAFLALIALAWYLGYDAAVQDPLLVTAMLLWSAAFGLGLGIGYGVIAGLLPDVTKVTGWVTRPFYFISGIIYPITMIPPEYHHLLSWNPLLHMTEFMRHGYFRSYSTTLGDPAMLLEPLLAVWMVSLLLYRRYRFTLVMTR